MNKGTIEDPIPLPFDYGHEQKKFGDAFGNFPEHREVPVPLAALARRARIDHAARLKAPDPGLEADKIDALPRVYFRVTGLGQYPNRVFWVSRLRESWV